MRRDSEGHCQQEQEDRGCGAKPRLGRVEFVVAISEANYSDFPTILVVEDEFLVRTTLVQYLQEHGCTVLEAENGERAIAICGSSQRIDILLTDINLDGPTTGWDIAKAFRAGRPEVAVVYTSGNGHDNSRCVSGSQFFGKPYRLSDILNVCRNPPKAFNTCAPAANAVH